MTATTSDTLLRVLVSRGDSIGVSRGIQIASVLFITALTAAAAQISIPLPLTAVPLTFQPMVVLVGGLALGSRLAFASQVLYLAAGIRRPSRVRSLGNPAARGAPSAWTDRRIPDGLSGGGVRGGISRRARVRNAVHHVRARDVRRPGNHLCLRRDVARVVRAPLTGSAPVGMQAAIATGLYPFILPDAVKLAVAAGLVPTLWRLVDAPAHASETRVHTALTIAGSDSGAGAGIQADLKTFAAHGVYGTSAITAVTAQNTLGVTMFEAVSAASCASRSRRSCRTSAPTPSRPGMLRQRGDRRSRRGGGRAIFDVPFLVVDPVMIAKSGDRLIDEDAMGSLKTELLRQAFLVTPNIPEAEALSG